MSWHMTVGRGALFYLLLLGQFGIVTLGRLPAFLDTGEDRHSDRVLRIYALLGPDGEVVVVDLGL